MQIFNSSRIMKYFQVGLLVACALTSVVNAQQPNNPERAERTTKISNPATEVNAELNNALNSLAGASWREAERLERESRLVLNASRQLASVNTSAFNVIIERSDGADLLHQAIYHGALEAADSGSDCASALEALFERTATINSDPIDIQDRSRTWVLRGVMLRNLAIRIARLSENREIEGDELLSIAENPLSWLSERRRLSKPTPSTPARQKVSNNSLMPTSGVGLSEPLKSSPRASQSFATNTSGTNRATTPWLVWAVMIVAAVGLLWLVITKRK